MNMIKEIVQASIKLPPFSMVIQKALQLIEDPRSSAQQVVEVIQYDPAITFEVLKICNSAYFGLKRKVSSLKEALVMIGFDQLLHIILSQESSKIFLKDCSGYDLKQGDLWRHSVACALLSKIIAKHQHELRPNTIFTAALIHDIGKMVLHRYVKNYFEKIKLLIEEEALSFSEAEKRVLGIDHAELGALVAERWSFPEEIIWAVRFHHAPLATTHYVKTIDLVYLSDLIAMLTGIGGGADALNYHGHVEIIERNSLKEDDLEHFMAELSDQLGLIEVMLQAKVSLGKEQVSWPQ
ncbi:MAG: HDOD domain-containing protein [Thermodesulfobacteriota bacterium]